MWDLRVKDNYLLFFCLFWEYFFHKVRTQSWVVQAFLGIKKHCINLPECIVFLAHSREYVLSFFNKLPDIYTYKNSSISTEDTQYFLLCTYITVAVFSFYFSMLKVSLSPYEYREIYICIYIFNLIFEL